MAFAEQLVKAKPFSVCLTGGEPTTRKDYFQIANYLKENMIPVSTVTSGYLVDDEMAKRCVNALNMFRSAWMVQMQKHMIK